MKTHLIFLLILMHFFCIFSSGESQIMHVELNDLTTLDDPDLHITLLKPKPSAKLQFPKIDTTDARFFDIFYTWEVKEDPNIDVMILPKKNVDELYIDINNDENLTNDGSPFLFSKDVNNFYFDIISKHDRKQKTKIILQRKPELPDSLLKAWVDQDGNLNKKLARLFGGMRGNFNYEGEKGTFFFDDRVTLRRGKLKLDDEIVQIGLFDYTNNGLFNDNRDVVIIDLDGNGKLEYSNANEVFKLNDIFTIGSQNYKINKLDKYGEWIELIETNEEATFYFLKEHQKENTEIAKRFAIEGELDQSFWELSFFDLNDKKVNMVNYKGKFVLLNFWGEWCKPCISEIPDLIETKNKIPKDKFEIISFAKSTRIDILKKVISEKEMDWTQILLPENINEKFKINNYPTNILILNDGKTYIRAHAVNYGFISSCVH